MAEFEIPADQVPQEALAVFRRFPRTNFHEPISNDASPEPISNEVEIDPVDTLDSNSLFELANKKMFSPIEYAQANPDKATNPDALRKLADTHARIRERGFTFSDLPSAGQAVKGVGHMIAGAAKQAWNYANAFVGIPLAGVAGAVTGQGPGFSEELDLEGQRRMIENLAGTESAVTGLAQLPGRAIGKAIHRAGTVSGLGKRYTEQSEQDKSKAFFDDLGKAQVAGEIVQGKGGLTGAVSGETQKELVQAGKPIRPSEVETLAAGDPLSFMLFGKAFGAAGGAVSKALPAGGGALIQKASEAATKVGGRAIQTAGKLTEFGGAATKVAGKVLPIVGAVKGTAVAGPAGTIGGLAAGGVAGRTTERIGRGIASAGEDVAQFGESVATGANVTPYVQAARDVFASAPIVASDVAQGAGFDLALAAATSESPQETEAAAAFGTVLGGLKGVGRGALKVAQGQILLPRQWGSAKVVPSYGSFSALDALHSQASATAAPGVTLRANAIREFLQGSGDRVQAYLLPDAASMEKAVTDILIRQGASPEAAQATAKSAAESKGMFANELVDDAGVSRRVVLLNEVDAAPHEAFHGIQDVLGEAGNQIVDGLVFQEYAPQWEALGQQYARRLGGVSENWRETVLDKSGWGNAAAAEKALRDAANKIEAESGATATPEAARALAEGVLQAARENGAGWRDILTTEEASAEANRYLARELAAENFDAAFKRLGAGLTEGNTLPEKLARIIAKTAAFLGAEPLSGTRTEGLSIEPRQAVTEAVVGLGRELIQPRTEAPAPTVAKPVEGRAAEGGKAVLMADELAVRNPASSQILRKIASAISSGQGLKVDYRTAPGEPAGNPASSRDQRRAVIEAFRDMPESVRPLWEKLNFPDRVEATKNKGFQIVGWSPENFAANAAKMARFIAEISPKAPEAKSWSQYEIDPATKSFTPAGWEKLYSDVQTFVANQQAGGTGSGRQLQLPANATELNISVPRLQEGSLQPLNQAAADFINTLFNLPIPETPRISRKGGTPGNIVAQDIARANEPLVGPRVVEPGRARSESEFKGFAGRRIQEVNPLRARMEKAASDAGVSFPSLIETSQRLNLDHVADVTAAPEALPVRGVTDTLRAGFLPAEETLSKNAYEDGLIAAKKNKKEYRPAVINRTGEIFEGGTHEDAIFGAAGNFTQRGFVTPDGKFLTLLEVARREAAKQPETLRAGFLPAEIAGKPASEIAEKILKSSAQEFIDFTTSYKGEKYGGGLTGLAIDIGRSLKTAEDLQAYRKAEAEIPALSEAARASKDIDMMFSLPSRTQFFREILEAATEGSLTSEYVKKHYDPNYKAPFPKEGVLPEAQFLPGENESYSEMLNRVNRTYEENLNDPNRTYYNYKRTEAEKTVPEAAPITTQALPKRAADETKLLPAGAAGVSKAWVLPSGKIEQLGPQWHHDWLDQNKEVQKKYGLEVPAFEGGDADAVRESALKKGFVRINYGRNTGTLTVEARAKDWSKQKAAVEKIIEKNLDDIDNVTVHLLDENVQKVVDSASERLFNYDENVEKMANLPFITKGEVRGQFLPEASPEIETRLKTAHESVKDEAGNPKPFYHGSFTAGEIVESGGFNINKTSEHSLFGPGFYFTDAPEVAGGANWRNKIRKFFGKAPVGYATKTTGRVPREGEDKSSSGVYPAFLDLKNPLDINKSYGQEEVQGFLTKLSEDVDWKKAKFSDPLKALSSKDQVTGYELYEALQQLSRSLPSSYSGLTGRINAKKIVPWLEHLGFDGISYIGGTIRKDFPKHSAMVAWKPEQIISPYTKDFEGSKTAGQFLPEGNPKERTEDLKQRGLFVGNKTPEEFFKDAVAPSEYWVSPDGDVFHVSGGLMRHDSWAKENIVGEDFTGKILNVVPVARDLGPERYASQAKKLGWLQVYVSPVRDKGIFADGKMNRSQKAVLEDYAFQEKLPVYGRTNDRLLISSTEEFKGTSQFLPSENKDFVQELEKIRKGESGGQTFNADGSVWQSPEMPSDIVTLASVNIPREKLTAAEFEKATASYQELLAQPNIAAGVFAFEQGGKPAVSVDINAVVPQEFRDNSLAFAKANDQVAIWDAAKNETVDAGGSGNTRITSPEQMRAAAESLVTGEPFQFLPAEQTGLPGISSGREFDRKAIEGMSQSQLKDYFPEAIIPKKNTEYIPSDIAGSPLAKAAGDKEAAIQAFSDKLVQFYRQYEDNPSLQAGAKWYSEFTPLLKKEFGKDSRIFAELLAATSPNNAPQINFAFALDAFRNWKAGKYDKMVSKFNEGLNKLADGGLEKIYQRDLKAGKVENPPESPSDATYLAHWITKNDLIPKSSSGKRFSMHSVPVLKVLARKWLELNTGLKTDNFIKNLVGEGDEATIDVWADRTMRRLGYEGFADRWRILPRNKTRVTDTDFIFSQQAFRKAAEALELKPSALQGALWFAEKHLWSERGWGKLDLGDYRTELERMPQLRAGFASREATAKAESRAPKSEQKELEIVPR